MGNMSSPNKSYSLEELDAMDAQAAVVDSTRFGRADAQQTQTQEIPRPPEQAAQPEQYEFTGDELDKMEVERLAAPDVVLSFDEFKQARETKKRLASEGKLPSGFDIATQAIGGLLVTAKDAIASAISDPIDSAARSAATVQSGVSQSAIGLLQMGRMVDSLRRPTIRINETGEFGTDRLDDPAFQARLTAAGATARPVTDHDLAQWDYDRYTYDKGIEQELNARATQTAPTEFLTSILTGRAQEEAPVQSQATAVSIATDPLNLLPIGAGSKALGLSRLGKRFAASTLGAVEKVSAGAVDVTERAATRLAEAVEGKIGVSPGAAVAASAGALSAGGVMASAAGNNDAAAKLYGTAGLIAGTFGLFKGGQFILRSVPGTAGAAKMILRESAGAADGLDDAAKAAVFSNPNVPDAYKTGLLSGASVESTPRRIAQNTDLPKSIRVLASTLDNQPTIQAVRGASAVAKGAVKGAAASLPFAAIASAAGKDEQAASMVGAGVAFGVAGAAGERVLGVGSRRKTEQNADIGRFLVDTELSGGDVNRLAQMKPEELSTFANLQGLVRQNVDVVPLGGVDFAANQYAQTAPGAAGLFVIAEPGFKPKVIVNIDARRTAPLPHEIAHAIIGSGAMDGKMRGDIRQWVGKLYAPPEIIARAQEYAANVVQAENATAATIRPKAYTREQLDAIDAGALTIEQADAANNAPTPEQVAIKMDDLSQAGLARGDVDPLDWARDEIFAEQFRKGSGAMDFGAIRRGLPAGGMLSGFVEGVLGANGRALSAAGIDIDPSTGSPRRVSEVFAKNPILKTDIKIVRQLESYAANYRRWLGGAESDAARGVPLARNGRPAELANNPLVTFHDAPNGVRESVFARVLPSGEIVWKSPDEIREAERQQSQQVQAQIGSARTPGKQRLLTPADSTVGPRKVGDKIVIAGKTLPPSFDFMTSFPAHVRSFARQMELAADQGAPLFMRYNRIGTSESGSYKVINRGNVEAITREVLPFGWEVTSKGHLISKVVDLTSIRTRAMKAINDGKLDVFGNDIKQFESDVKTWMNNHKNNLPGENGIGISKRDAINGIMGIATNRNRAENPLSRSFGPGSAIKSIRLDRIDTVNPSGRQGFAFDYEKANMNLLPDDWNADAVPLDKF